MNNSYVAHIDILEMSSLVLSDHERAWQLLIDLSDVKQWTDSLGIYVVETGDGISDRVMSLAFSDTVLLFSLGNTENDLKAMCIMVTELFHKAIFRCVPVRIGISHGNFCFNFERSLYSGPALVNAYRIGEQAQWLGIVIDSHTATACKDANIGSGDVGIVTDWEIPLKDSKISGFAVNWPKLYENDLKIQPPVSVEQFYQSFENDFGVFDDLPQSVKRKYINTVEFMNAKLAE
jgi:hypothetical protein